MPVTKDALEHLHADLLGLFDAFLSHSSLADFMFFLSKPPRLAAGGHSGENEVASNSDGKTDTAVDDE